MEKQNIIKDIYYNKESGYGSQKDTLMQAKEKDKTINIQDVSDFYKTLSYKQQRYTYRGYNSFIPPRANFEIEYDIIDFGRQLKEKRYALIGTDIFSKYMYIVVINTKQPQEVAGAFEKILAEIGIPEQVYSDQEGAFKSDIFRSMLRKYKIKQIMTLGGTNFINPLIRTVRDWINQRLHADDEPMNDWYKYVDAVIKKYNNSIQTTTKFKPVEARKKINQQQVYFNIYNAGVRNRKYPELHEGDKVRVLKKRDKFKKINQNTFSKEVYSVVDIDKSNNRYILDDPSTTRKQIYLRHEIYKVT